MCTIAQATVAVIVCYKQTNKTTASTFLYWLLFYKKAKPENIVT
jgi:hypothetical protein